MVGKYGVMYTLQDLSAGTISGGTRGLLDREVDKLKEMLCAFAGAEDCVLALDIDTALHLALCAAGVHRGDHVLCSGFAPKSHIQAILLRGAIPVSVDINPNTWNMDPYLLDHAIGKCARSKKKKPVAVLLAERFGLPCNHEMIGDVCSRHGIASICDSSESLGGQTPNAFSSSRFTIVNLCKEPHKSTPDGCAAILCKSPIDAQTVQKIRNAGESADQIRIASRESVRAGIALRHLEGWAQRVRMQQATARAYHSHLQGQLRTQQVPEGYSSACNRFVVALPQKVDRGNILVRMHEKGAACRVFRPSPWETGDEQWGKLLLMNAQQAYDRLVELPMNPFLGTRVTGEIVRFLLESIEEESMAPITV